MPKDWGSLPMFTHFFLLAGKAGRGQLLTARAILLHEAMEAKMTRLQISASKAKEKPPGIPAVKLQRFYLQVGCGTVAPFPLPTLGK
jgi:hypothetical protein